MTGIQTVFTLDAVVRRIFELRGQRVMLDADLAVLYGVDTGRIPCAVRRNPGRFPLDFAFQLSAEEWANLKSIFGISSVWGGRRSTPYAFTKYGALMLSSVLNSSLADEISLLIINAFSWLRQAIPGHKELAAKVVELESARQSFRLYSSLLSRQITNSAKSIFSNKT
ncbi:MAG: ORF6N domain-containing protein [Desulfovibrionaceae bacterium]|nr:ORF6N domain-containing protein [Desulfovibrionaceae bacterium]